MVASEQERTLQIAQTAGQVCIADRAVSNLEAALGQGIVIGTLQLQIHEGDAGSVQIRIEHGEKIEIQLAIGGYIEIIRRRELHAAVGTHVSSLPLHVQFRHVNHFMRNGETHRFLVVQLHVFHLECQATEVAIYRPACRLENWTTEVESASHSRVSGELVAEISVPEGIEIDLVHANGKIGGIAGLQSDTAAYRQRALGQIGSAGEAKFILLSRGVKIEIAEGLMIHG